MTPFEFDILLWYRAHALDHDVVRDNPPIWEATRVKFFAMELLQLAGGDEQRTYKLTERGQVFVDAALATRLPVKRWVMEQA